MPCLRWSARRLISLLTGVGLLLTGRAFGVCSVPRRHAAFMNVHTKVACLFTRAPLSEAWASTPVPTEDLIRANAPETHRGISAQTA